MEFRYFKYLKLFNLILDTKKLLRYVNTSKFNRIYVCIHTCILYLLFITNFKIKLFLII